MHPNIKYQHYKQSIFTKTVEKMNYQKPTMRVVKLKQQIHLLAGSNNGQGSSASMNVVYGEEEWTE